MRHKPDPAQKHLHYRRFVDFATEELRTGGPDHHMKQMVSLASNFPAYTTKAWLAGCYVGPYNEPTGEFIFNSWQGGAKNFDADGFAKWVEDNWSALSIRQERRPVKSRAKFAKFFASYNDWIVGGGIERLQQAPTLEKAWEETEKIRFVGRYAGMKLLETLRRMIPMPWTFTDIRSDGAWSPRLALSYLYPEKDEWLNHTSGKKNAHEVNEWATNVFDTLFWDFIPDLFHFEVLLCDYKQAVDGKYYPGRPLDSAMGHWTKVTQNGGSASTFWELRELMFDHRLLGEFRGWHGRRKELGRTMIDHGYIWSDLTYNYSATTDFAEPVRW